MNPQALPDTMHGLLAAAIADARRLDRNLYRPHHHHWHLPDDDGLCSVCLAGMSIARTLKWPAGNTARPWDFPEATQHKLEALNAMRCGCWRAAYRVLHQRTATAHTACRLFKLGLPAHLLFVSWEECDLHLKSLESFLPELRLIESEDDHPEALNG